MSVFVVNMVSDDLGDAQRFGDLEFVNHKYIFPDEISDDGEMPSSFVYHMRKFADRFNPDADYLLIAGDHLQLIAFTAELVRRHSKFKVLRWDRLLRSYYVVQIQNGAAFMARAT